MRPNLNTGSGLAAILLWSTTFAFARSLSEKVGPVTAGAVVYLIAGCFCLVRLASSGRPLAHLARLPRKYLVGCGSLFCCYTAAIYLALGLAMNREQLLDVALVNYLWPALTILFSIPILKKRARVWLFPGTFLALTGVFLVLTQEADVSWSSWQNRVASSPAAYALALGAAISWGLYSNLARRWSVPGSGGAVEWFIPTTGLVLLGLRSFVPETTTWSVGALAEAAALAAITGVGYVLWDLAMRRGNLLLVVACSYFTPLLSTLVSCLYLEVKAGTRLWAGCFLLIAGSLITWRSVSDRAEAEISSESREVTSLESTQ